MSSSSSTNTGTVPLEKQHLSTAFLWQADIQHGQDLLHSTHHLPLKLKLIAIRKDGRLRSSSIASSSYLTRRVFAMADGLNQARAMRILEIMNDFRTVQLHISSHVSRAQANPPDQASYYHDGYVVMRQCSAEAQAILATLYNSGNQGPQAGGAGEGEAQRATLQRIILDASTRRFQGHKIYLRAAAATRWAQMRQQILRGEKPNGQHANALRAIDQRLRDELSRITDEHVVGDLRGADRRAGYWLDEDPSLERMLAWIRMQR